MISNTNKLYRRILSLFLAISVAIICTVFFLPKSLESKAAVIADGLEAGQAYCIRNAYSGLLLTLNANGTGDGTKIVQNELSTNGDYARFVVNFNSSTGDYYLVPSIATSKAIEVQNGNGSGANLDGAIIQIWNKPTSTTYMDSQCLKIQKYDGSGNSSRYKILTKTSNYTKMFVIPNCSTTLGETVLQKPAYNTNDLWYFDKCPGMVSLNANITEGSPLYAVLSSSGVNAFTFIPSTTGYYTAETSNNYSMTWASAGSTPNIDTLVYVSAYDGSNYIHYMNDDDGYLYNASRGFYAVAGRPVLITVKGVGFANGEYFLHVWKQRVSTYTFNYGSGDINTYNDRLAVGTFSTNAYRVWYNLDQQNTHPLLGDSYSILKRLNSEIFFFAGHGDKSELAFANNTKFYTTNIQKDSMRATKLAVFASCHSATGIDGQYSIAEAAVKRGGAKTAVGWIVLIDDYAASDFTDRLFPRLLQGKTVQTAVDEVIDYQFDNDISGSGTLSKCEIFGNKNLQINSYAINRNKDVTQLNP